MKDSIRPMVSIVMPTYNSSATIVDSINSVQAQSLNDFELLVVDNGSFDNTKELVISFTQRDSRVKLFSCCDKGASHARNYGIKVARGRYIAFIDSDDLWASDKLEKQLQFMSLNNSIISCTAYQPFISLNGEIKKFSVRPVPNIIGHDSLLYTCKVGCSTVIFDTDFLPAVQFPCVYKEDYALWLDITKSECHIYGLNNPLVFYRVSNNSLSGNKFREFIRQWSIYRSYLKMSFTRSLYYMFFYTVHAVLKRL